MFSPATWVSSWITSVFTWIDETFYDAQLLLATPTFKAKRHPWYSKASLMGLPIELCQMILQAARPNVIPAGHHCYSLILSSVQKASFLPTTLHDGIRSICFDYSYCIVKASSSIWDNTSTHCGHCLHLYCGLHSTLPGSSMPGTISTLE
jgi:hypothetical protein